MQGDREGSKICIARYARGFYNLKFGDSPLRSVKLDLVCELDNSPYVLHGKGDYGGGQAS